MEFFKRTKPQKTVCIHTRNLISLVDLTPKDESFAFYNNHIKACEICKREYKKISEHITATQVFIPKPIMENDLKESFEREMHELLVNLKINDGVVQKENVIGFLSKLNWFGEAFIKSLNSKYVYVGLGLSAATFYLLKHYH